MGQKTVERAQGFLIDPVETFRDARTDDPGDALAYFGTLLAVNIVLLCLLVTGGLVLVSGGEPGLIVFAVLVTVIADAIGTIVLFVLAALTLHLFVVLLIGGNGMKETFKVLAYAATPGLLLGWVPLIGLPAWVWTLGLAAVGVRELHETTTGRAAVSVLPLPVLALLLFVLPLIILSGSASEEPSFLSARYTYELTIQTETPIENVTFLVPIPAHGDSPAIGPEPITDEFYSGRLPENISSSLLLVEGRTYLRLTAPVMDAGEEISVEYHNYTSLGQKFSPEVVPHLVNTLHPFGNESLFSSRQDLTPADCSPGEVKTHGNNPGYSCTYTIPVYAYYENGTRVEISSEIEGRNDWSEFFDAWISNRYSDHYHLTITGEPEGWISAGGTVVAGSGIYREWQVGPLPASDT
ncbi:YIP1 family protein [uncultured Methanofollis sp.]|uniref:YIP1 family protein n=1 Tax=uncultured Methanofollis sp. TaxID=262500 RepID=UPI002639821A|nr:Yip1 family protein [uncultured Methanofollis sp.]